MIYPRQNHAAPSTSYSPLHSENELERRLCKSSEITLNWNSFAHKTNLMQEWIHSHSFEMRLEMHAKF
jgi:hypothetical protein